ncbi:hypothetical protein FW781_19645 [Chryseobacterium panacisoli]|uniref:Uncharacterized protein n=1 Tax=Chryseobacterium panacisoli TaxID=1807141 RepID=A0A5D8ZGK5_9FLAO|nr:hypothetical protein [Chryseobacterium panacisoli]TZF93182.1 hypothetical protein FW781_19645 [Chryseobacterium panacisoli]
MKQKSKLDDIIKEIEAHHNELPLVFQELEFKHIKLQKKAERKISSSYYNTQKLDVLSCYKPILRIEK